MRRGGVGVAASLAAFARGFDAALASEAAARQTAAAEDAEAIVAEGARRCAEWQDAAYAETCRRAAGGNRALDAQYGDGSDRLLRETARAPRCG